MVIIGTDAVSLYPSMTKPESADEVAEAVLESSLKWEGVNWKAMERITKNETQEWSETRSDRSGQTRSGPRL